MIIVQTSVKINTGTTCCMFNRGGKKKLNLRFLSTLSITILSRSD